MTNPLPAAADSANIRDTVRDLIEDILGAPLDNAGAGATFAELGVDSLVLTQVALLVKERFKTTVTLRQLMEEFSSIDLLAGYLQRSTLAAAQTGHPPMGASPATARAPASSTTFDSHRPPAPGARLGREKDGTPAWFVPDPRIAGKYLRWQT